MPVFVVKCELHQCPAVRSFFQISQPKQLSSCGSCARPPQFCHCVNKRPSRSCPHPVFSTRITPPLLLLLFTLTEVYRCPPVRLVRRIQASSIPKILSIPASPVTRSSESYARRAVLITLNRHQSVLSWLAAPTPPTCHVQQTSAHFCGGHV